MKRVSFAVILFVLATFWTVVADTKTIDLSPEQKPFFVWVNAIKELDIDSFKEVYSKRMQKQMAKRGWRKVLEKSNKGLKRRFGDFSPENFSVTFQAGKKNEGKLLIKFNGEKQPPLSIILEDGKWKINEN